MTVSVLELVAPAAIATVIAVVGWLLQRSIAQIDAKLTTTASTVEVMNLKMATNDKLIEYQESRIKELEHHKEVLHEKVGAFDKHIAVLVALGKIPRVD